MLKKMSKKVLIVEDNELNMKLFADLLEAHGYETRPVSYTHLTLPTILLV